MIRNRTGMTCNLDLVIHTDFLSFRHGAHLSLLRFTVAFIVDCATDKSFLDMVAKVIKQTQIIRIDSKE